MAAPETDLLITADGTQIRGRPRVDEPGLYVAADGFVGVDDGVEVRREAIARPGERGEFDLSVFSGARVVSIDVIALANTVTGLRQRRTELKRIGQGGRRFEVTFDHLAQTLSGIARRGGQTKFTDSGVHNTGLLYAKAFVQWVFPDPVLRGKERATVRAAAVTASQKGDAPIAPMIDVYGPWPNGYTISTPLGSLTVTTALGSGQMETVDVGASRVYRGGVRQLRAISVPGRWEIPGGELGVPHTITGAGGSGSMVVRTYDAHE